MATLEGSEITPAYVAGGQPKLWPIADLVMPILVEVRFANGGSAGIQAPAGMWRQAHTIGLDAKLTKHQLEDAMVVATLFATKCFPQLVEWLAREFGNNRELVALALKAPELLPSIVYDAKLLAAPEAIYVRQQLSKWRVKSERKYQEVATAWAASKRAESQGRPRVEAIERAVGGGSRSKAVRLFRQGQRLTGRDEIAQRWRESLSVPSSAAEQTDCPTE